MNVLVDTHAVIWFITDNSRLSPVARKIIESPENICFVSIATFWEIGIKSSLGRLDLNTTLERLFKIIEESGFQLLPISINHILNCAKLEFYHHDPFDRIVISQAQCELIPLISKDEKFSNYDISLIWD